MSRWLLRALGLLAGVSVAASAALLHFIVQTPSGLQFVVAHFPQRIGPVTLELEGVAGTLGKEVHIKRLEIDHERVHLRFEDVAGRIALAGLLHQSLTVPEVSARLMTLTVKPRLRAPPPGVLHFLPRWMVIRAHRATLDRFVLYVPGGRRFDLVKLGGSGIVRQSLIRVTGSYGTYGALTAHATGEVRAANPIRIASDGDVALHFDGQPDWSAHLSTNGDLKDLPFKGSILAPMQATFAGDARELTGSWHWTSEADIQSFTLMPWGGSNVLGLITGHVSANGDASGFGGRGPLTPAGLHAGVFDAMFHGIYADGVLTADEMQVTHRASKGRAAATGTITVVDHGPQLDLHGAWSDFRWPLTGQDIAVRSSTGSFALSGIWPYAVEATGQGTLPRFAWLTAIPVHLTATLSRDHLDIAQAMVDAADGTTELNGRIDWTPARRWQIAGTSTGVDFSIVRKDVPGRLNLAFDAHGTGFDSTQDFDVNLHSLGGTLRKVAARGEGRFGRHRGEWHFDHLRANLGGTNLALDGEAGSNLDLQFGLDSDDLSLLGTGATGKLTARGNIGGSARTPHVDLVANGTKLAWSGVSLRSLDANIDFDGARTGGSTARVTLRDLVYGKRTLNRLALTIDGTAPSHIVDLTLDAQNLHADSHATGSFVDGLWRGQLLKVNIKGSDPLNLSLEKPSALGVSANEGRVEAFCLTGSPARLCADADWTPAKWVAHLTANDLPMSALTSGLSPGISYQGTISVAAQGSGVAGQPAAGQLRAELADAQLLHQEANKRVQVTTLGSGFVLIQAGAQSIDGEVSLDAGEVGTIKGKASLQRVADSWSDNPLRGTLQLHTAELGFIALYVPQIDRAAGKLAADLTLTGTAGVPLLNGTLKLADAELNLYQVNFSMHQTAVEAQLNDNMLDFSGSARIGSGAANAKGHLEWHDSLPHGRFELNGDTLRVTDIPEAQIDASPNLVFAIDGRKIDVTGSVNVPYARITPADLTGAVRSSPDEIIVGADAPESGPPFDVTSDITLTLADKVSIDTSGLTGRLTGTIELRTGVDNITRGTGELQIAEGRYAAYGRKLDIQHGRLIFTGGPVADPGVDIRAVKQFPENVAGINVRGTLLQPRMSFFSEPSLPQSQIVSLILAGGSFGSGQDSTIITSTHAATPAGTERTGNELLAQGGAILAQQLGERLGLSSKLGIEDVTIESDLNNDTALVLGRYLSPRLYVSYGISLTEALNSVKLRYSLNDHWTVRTEVGEEHSAELVYTIEK